MRTLILLGILLVAFALVSEVAQTALSISVAVVFAIVLFLSVFLDLSDLSYGQKSKDVLNKDDITELGVPAAVEEADAIIAEVSSTTPTREMSNDR